MRLVDRHVCVKCGKTEFAPSSGKSSRVFNGVCDGCYPELMKQENLYAPSKDVSKSK